MTSIGRGRGWGKPAQDSVLRRPGQVASKEKELDEWVERVNRLDIDDESFAKSPNSPIANLVSEISAKVSDEDSKHLDNLCKEALDDKTFSIKLIIAFTHPSNKKSCLLSALQPYYDKREELLKQNPERFYNLVFILGEVYHRFIVGGIPVRAVEKPLIVCLKTLLELAGEDEIELAATQVAINGRTLHSRAIEGLPELFIYAREVLATRNLSARSRGMLLLMIDLYNQKFMPLSGELQKFYAEQLGQETLLTMQRSSKGLLIVTDLQSNAAKPVDTVTNNSSGILMQVPTKQDKSPPKNFPPHGNGGRPTNSVPRAIRGSGAAETKEPKGDKKFSGKKDKNTSDAQWSNWNDNASKKNWGHDDRFSKDY